MEQPLQIRSNNDLLNAPRDEEGKYLLQNADLRGAKLGGYGRNISLVGAHLEGAHLEGAELIQVNLTAAHLEGAHLEGAKLIQVDLIGAYLEGAYLQNSSFDHVKLVAAHGLDRTIFNHIRFVTLGGMETSFTENNQLVRQRDFEQRQLDYRLQRDLLQQQNRQRQQVRRRQPSRAQIQRQRSAELATPRYVNTISNNQTRNQTRTQPTNQTRNQTRTQTTNQTRNQTRTQSTNQTRNQTRTQPTNQTRRQQRPQYSIFGAMTFGDPQRALREVQRGQTTRMRTRRPHRGRPNVLQTQAIDWNSDIDCENNKEIVDPVSLDTIPSGRGFRLSADGKCYDAETMIEMKNRAENQRYEDENILDYLRSPLTRSYFTETDLRRIYGYERYKINNPPQERQEQPQTQEQTQEQQQANTGGKRKTKTKKNKKRKSKRKI